MKNIKALLVIDMQKGSFTAATPRFDTEGVCDRINKLAALCRAQNYPVVYIQHDGTGTGEFEKNAPDWENLDALIVEPNDVRIDKYANDVFYRSQLQARLTELNVSDLLITGCATDFCVESTVQSALTLDYTITVVADGHTTGERPHLSARKVIEHYNWVWQNMIPTKGNIAVKTFDEIKQQFFTETEM
ncbi:cysteine hydrolase family protein [Draconibacterium sp. IB214405]|uniref:cysteine hydrolase family protein n=1 Tax=Draconibacterium sp. IB214405 TaxID=3097352 RepID=UPI002A17F41C|nr:cysteine hydrolase family protein [Draconibacterium sp. IB214405]MDX8340947.1 cysteine hydrolase family protein [Draconibacterium sp. IB214405]